MRGKWLSPDASQAWDDQAANWPYARMRKLQICHSRAFYAYMHRSARIACMQQWSAARIAAAIAKLEDAGYSQPKLARLAGISQSTVNRWSRGKVQPGYDTVWRLAAALFRGHPDLARQLVEASGYAWAEPDPSPAPPLIDPEVEADIRRLANDDDEAEMLLAAMRKRRMEKLRTTDGKPAA
jgi:transcriptional regulator with XRE-family HTH domain